MKMEAVEIKSEPLDEGEEFNQITQEEVIIKSEHEPDYTSLVDIQIREPEVQIKERLCEFKDEITNDKLPPTEPVTPTRSKKSDQHSETVSNHCKFCNMFFKSRTTLKLHERNCNQKNDCRLCGVKFVTAYALNTHMDKMHNRQTAITSPPKAVTNCKIGRPPKSTSAKCTNQCEICSLKFANSRDLNNHKKKHNTCQQCGENFKVYDDLMEHICPNATIKQEVEVQSDVIETPTKKIFKATNSMVVIPGQQFQSPIELNSKAAQPKSRKSLNLFQDIRNASSSDEDQVRRNSNNNLVINTSSCSGFSVVTKDTDFEAFAQQMLKGFSNNVDTSPRKRQVSTNDSEKELMIKKELDSEDDVSPQPDGIVEPEDNSFQFQKQSFIKKEPMDEDEQSETNYENSSKPLMPLPLPFIKNEPQDQEQNETDATDFLLEELFDRKLKSLAKGREETKFDANAFGFRVKKEIPLAKTNAFKLKSPKAIKRPHTLSKVSNAVVQSKSRRKAGPQKIREDISENVTPPLEINNIPKQSKSAKQPRKKLKLRDDLMSQPLFTLKDKNSGDKPLKQQRKNILLTKKLVEISSDIKAPPGFVNIDTILSTKTFAGVETEMKPSIAFDINAQTGFANIDTILTHPVPTKTELSDVENSEKATSELIKPEIAASMEDVAQNCSSNNTDNDTIVPQVKVPEIAVDADFDFEEAIQSSMLPNIQHVDKVIKSLTEEYKKAEKVKHEESTLPLPLLPLPTQPPLPTLPLPLPPTLVNESLSKSAEKALSPEIIEARNRPCSLFFPILDDTQVYSTVANALNKNYRYVWVCPICPREYTNVRPFKKHLLTIHFRSQEELVGKTFELRPEVVFQSAPDETFCHLCHVTLADNMSLQKHQAELHNGEEINSHKKKKHLLHKCYICSKLCSTRSILAEHMNSDCGKNPQYGCNVCDKKFHTKSTLTLHKTMHTGELPHSCSFCQKRFRTRGQLTVHTRTHTGEKPFPCKVCNQRFTHRETLIAHLSRHIDMKRYKCYGCDQFFSCISGLKTHRQTRPETCGLVELNARAVGPRVRVIKGNVIFEPQPVYNARLAKAEKTFQASHILDHNYHMKDSNHHKKVSKQAIKSDPIVITP